MIKVMRVTDAGGKDLKYQKLFSVDSVLFYAEGPLQGWEKNGLNMFVVCLNSR